MCGTIFLMTCFLLISILYSFYFISKPLQQISYSIYTVKMLVFTIAIIYIFFIFIYTFSTRRAVECCFLRRILWTSKIMSDTSSANITRHSGNTSKIIFRQTLISMPIICRVIYIPDSYIMNSSHTRWTWTRQSKWLILPDPVYVQFHFGKVYV